MGLIGSTFQRAGLALVAIFAIAMPNFAFARAAGDWQALIQSALSANSAAQAVNQNEIVSLDAELTRLEDSENPEDVAALQTTAARLATLFLTLKRPQDALWALNRGHLEEPAVEVENAIKVFLSRLDLTNGKLVGVGVSGSKFISGGANLRALMKRDNSWPGSVDYEVFAYEFDRFLGLNRVPVTIRRPFGNEEYSVQFVIEEAGAGIDFRGAYSAHLKNVDEVYPFDLMTGQTDRHSGNSLSSFGHLVLIDNSRMFGGGPPSVQYYLASGGRIQKRLLSRLYQITPKEMHARFDGLIGAEKVNYIMGKITEIMAAYPNPGIKMVAPKIPAPPARVEVAAPIDIGDFDNMLRLSRRSQNQAEKKRATKQVLDLINEMPTLERIVQQHGSERRLAHFFEEHMDKIKPESMTRYIRFIQRMHQPERAHLRIINNCQQLLAG